MRKGAGVGLVFVSPLGVRMKYTIRLHFTASNNVTEYEALLNELRIASKLEIRLLEIRGDSQLVVDQVMKESDCRSDAMIAYNAEARKLEQKFNGLELKHISRCLNETTDELVKMASGREPIPPSILSDDQYEPSIHSSKRKRNDTGSGGYDRPRATNGQGGCCPLGR
ncbi:unnamed protein product [Urochloa humidicola]